MPIPGGLNAASPGAVQQLGALVLGEEALNAQEEVVLGSIAQFVVGEDGLDVPLLELLQNDDWWTCFRESLSGDSMTTASIRPWRARSRRRSRPGRTRLVPL
jgi:hypothetical protein